MRDIDKGTDMGMHRYRDRDGDREADEISDAKTRTGARIGTWI